MRVKNAWLLIIIIVSLVVFFGCERDIFKEYYGRAIYSYTPPSVPDLNDYPKQFLVEDDVNYILSFEDAIVAPSPYDLAKLYTFTQNEMCGLITSMGYECHDMNDNLLSSPTGSFMYPLTGAITGAQVAGADTLPLYACRKDTIERVIYDHYVSTSYPCSMPFGTGHITQRILGKIYSSQQPNTQKLVFCYWPTKGDYLVNVGQCDAGTAYQSDLGYVYTSQQTGTIPLIRCRFNVTDEHYVLSGTTQCNPNSVLEATWYILPFCTETDNGNDIGVKGTTTGLDGTSYTDSCVETTKMQEFYCDTLNPPSGVSNAKVVCPAPSTCSDGACVVAPTNINFIINKTSIYDPVNKKINYTIVIKNIGEAVSDSPTVYVRDVFPADVMASLDKVVPEPTMPFGANELIWIFNNFGTSSGTSFTSSGTPRMYSSDGVFVIEMIISIKPGLANGTEVVNYVNLTKLITDNVVVFKAEDYDVVKIISPPSVPEYMRIVQTETYLPAQGGNLDAVETPVCPSGMNKFGEIFEFHGRYNTYGRKWAFCIAPGANGVVNTCSINSAADLGPWTMTCQPAACPSGTVELTGLIRHGYYVKVTDTRYNYVNMYSRVCISDNAVDSGSVKSCTDTGTQAETGQCDTATDLVCPSGQTSIDVVVGDPVFDAYTEQRGTDHRYHQFVYNRVCVDFKPSFIPFSNCGDSDGGLNYPGRGFTYTPRNRVTLNDVLGKDACVDSSHLQEYYCTRTGSSSVSIGCADACQEQSVYFQNPDATSFFVEHVGSCEPLSGNPVCGNNVIEVGEQCESDNDCSINEACSNCQCSVGVPTAYRISIPSAIAPGVLSLGDFDSFNTVLVGTCNDNSWVATALGPAECAALTAGRALILLQQNPYRLIIAADMPAGVTVALDVLSRSDEFNLHGPRVDINYGGPSLIITFPHCSDSVQNYDETGIDCGGSCAACVLPPSCSDGIQNQGETGIDCGGPCPACTYPPATPGTSGPTGGGGGKYFPPLVPEQEATECMDDWICDQWSECSASGVQTRKCYLNDYPECHLIMQKPVETKSCTPPYVPVEPTCFDGVQNQDETGIDCGGVCMPCARERPAWIVPSIIILLATAAALGFLVYYLKFLKKPNVLSPLKKYVKEARAKNIGDVQIRQILSKQGWSKTDIDKSMGKPAGK